MLTPFQQATARLPFAPTQVSNPSIRTPKLADSAHNQGHSAPDLPRALNFYADYSGCGHWRMIWPELLLNCYAKVNVQGGTVMIGDKNFYKAIKIKKVTIQFAWKKIHLSHNYSFFFI